MGTFRRAGSCPLFFLFVFFLVGCASTPPKADWPICVRDSGRENVIVFVHGVLGDADATWRNTQTGVYWPELITLDREFDSFAVCTVGYASPAMARTSTVEEVSQRVLRQLRDQRVFSRYKRVNFVAHSMGGLVVRRMLIELNRDIESLRRVRMVLYLSTPSQGSQIAELAAVLSSNPQFRDMVSAESNSFLQFLDNQWRNLLQDRKAMGLNLKSYCAYETGLTGGRMIAGRDSAATGCDDLYPIDLDHFAIAKPLNSQADPYLWVKARVLETSSERRHDPEVAVRPSPPIPPVTPPSEGQRSALRRRLQAYSGSSVRFILVGGDPQTRVMFEELMDTFKEAGWKIHAQEIGAASIVGANFPKGPYMTSANVAAPIVTNVFSMFLAMGLNVPLVPNAFMGFGRPADIVIVVH